MKSILTLAAAVAGLALFAGPALAQSTFYSDRGAFLANSSGTMTLDFEGLAPSASNTNYPLPAGLTLSGVTFTSNPSSPTVGGEFLFVVGNGANNYYPGNSVLSSQNSQPGATGDLRITFSHPVTAIGLDIGDNFHTATTATFTLSDGERFTRVPGNGTHFPGLVNPGPDFNFVGLTSRVPITYMDIQEPDNYSLNIDNFTFGTAAPQPSAAAINGFSDPVGFTLNGNSGGYFGQDATAHGVPALNGGTLHLTTTQGVPYTVPQGNTFFGSEQVSVYANSRQYVGQFYASFVYRYNGTNPLSFGPGDGFAFLMQNDPRGLHALGNSGIGNGRQGEGGEVTPSAAVEFGLFTGFGQPRGTQLAFNGDPGIGGIFRVPGAVNLISGDPISVVLSYNGAVLSENLTDTLTHASYSTSYTVDLPTALGTAYPYIGFSAGTGAAVADQTVSNFIFSSAAAPPVNAGPNLVVTAVASVPVDTLGTRYIVVTVTNTGTVAADLVQITGISLNGVIPPAGDIHNTLPTIPNLLPPGQSETKTVVYVVTPGATRAALNVGGIYTNMATGGIGHFNSAIRLALPPPAN